MRSDGTRWQKVGEHLVPREHWADAESRRRARIVAAMAVLVLFASLVRLLSFVWAGSLEGSLVFALTGACAAASLLHIRRGGLIARAGNLLLGAISLAVGFTTYYSGGFGVPLLAAVGGIPLFATLVGGRVAGTAWVVVALGIVVSFIAAEVLGVDIPDRVPVSARFGVAAIAYVLLPIVMYGIAVAYDWSREEAQRELLLSERARAAAVERAHSLEADRIASLGMLAAGVGHEINNPLSVLVPNLEFLRDNLVAGPRGIATEGVSDEIREVLDDSQAAAERIAGITEDLRLFSRLEDEGEIEQVDVRAVMDSALSLTRNEIRHRARIELKYDEIPTTALPASRLSQVFVNLLTNAAHAMEVGSVQSNRIMVAIGRDHEGWIRVEVSDTGHGVAPDKLSDIFKPFYTTKPKGEGTGLGLAICKEIITAMGGTMAARSVLGEGSSFSVRLPVVEGAERRGMASSSAPSAGGSAKKVLIIEDERAVAQALARMLPGHDVTIAEGGRAGLDVLQRTRDFDVVFCDLMMPELAGPDLYARFERSDPVLARAFVFMTAGVFTATTRDFVEQHRERCIDKPFDAAQVRRAVATRSA